MPPFDFGKQAGRSLTKTFNQAQNRQLQRKRQRALQQFRRRRLEHLAEKARKRRQQDQDQFEAKQEAAERRFKATTTEVPRSEVGLSGEGTVRMSTGEFAQLNAQEGQSQITVNASRFPFISGDGEVTMDRDAFQARSQLHLANARQRDQGTGIMVTNDDFLGINPLAEGKSIDLARVPKPLQPRALRGMMQRSTPTRQVDISADTSGANEQPQVPGSPQKSSVPEAPSLGVRALAGRLGTAAQSSAAGAYAGDKVVDAVYSFFTAQPTNEALSRAETEINNAVQAAQRLQKLPASERTRPAARLTTQLQSLDKRLAGFEQTEEIKRTRNNIRSLQRFTGRLTPGGRQQKAVQQGFSKLSRKVLQKALESDNLGDMNTALDNLRKSLNQGVTGSQ